MITIFKYSNKIQTLTKPFIFHQFIKRTLMSRYHFAKNFITLIIPKTNPILGEKGFQHPSFGKVNCSIPECEHKLCNQLCAPIKEKLHTGHGTHDGSREDSKFVSFTDLNGKNRPQYMKTYEAPIPNNDVSGINEDAAKTAELNSNPEMRVNVHMNSSRNPTQTPNSGSNDPTNIN